MASASRPWGSNLPRTDKDVRVWLNQRERNHIPLMAQVLRKQEQDNREAIIEMPLGTWMLELPEIQELKKECFESDVQLTDFCEYGLKDPENKLPHKRPTALLATFQLRRATRMCSGHGGKARQWTKGRLSKRFGNMLRLGYSQRWTPMFCRDVVED